MHTATRRVLNLAYMYATDLNSVFLNISVIFSKILMLEMFYHGNKSFNQKVILFEY